MAVIKDINRIVIPIDFSDNSKIIAESAAYFSGKFGASMYLVFVFQVFEDYSGFYVPQTHMTVLKKELFESAEKKLASFCLEIKTVIIKN